MAAISSAQGAPSGFSSAAPTNPYTGQLPEFIPLPREGQVEFYSGLRRGALNLLILPCKENDFRPPVKSVSLRRPGYTKGKRLIVLASLLEFLRGVQKEQEKQQPAKRPGTKGRAIP